MQAGATVLDFLCKTSYTSLAVPRGDWALIQIAGLLKHGVHHTTNPKPGIADFKPS